MSGYVETCCPNCGNHDWDGPVCKTCKVDLRKAVVITPHTTDAGYEDVEARLRERKMFFRNGATWCMSSEPDPDCIEGADAIAHMLRQRDDIKWRADVETRNATNARRWMEENRQRAEAAEAQLTEAREDLLISQRNTNACLDDYREARAEAERYKALAEGERERIAAMFEDIESMWAARRVRKLPAPSLPEEPHDG